MTESNVAWIQCPRCRVWRDPAIELECGCSALTEEGLKALSDVYRLLIARGRQRRLAREAAQQAPETTDDE